MGCLAKMSANPTPRCRIDTVLRSHDSTSSLPRNSGDRPRAFLAPRRLASLREGTGAPMPGPCLIGVGFPTSGPQVWTFTSCLLVMPVARLAARCSSPGSAGLGPRGGCALPANPVAKCKSVKGLRVSSSRDEGPGRSRGTPGHRSPGGPRARSWRSGTSRRHERRDTSPLQDPLDH